MFISLYGRLLGIHSLVRSIRRVSLTSRRNHQTAARILACLKRTLAVFRMVARWAMQTRNIEMPLPKGRWKSLSGMRRLVCDICRLGQSTPSIVIERRVNLADVVAARQMI